MLGYPYGYSYGNPYGYGGWLNSSYYYNPYATGPLALGSTVVDYSQPLVSAGMPVDQTQPVVADTSAAENDPNTTAAMADFDAARAAFRAGDYNAALEAVQRAMQRLPNDAALHEFRGLVLFAQGNYREAAATIHAVLAGGPGWNWDTLRGLYPSVDVYEQQLRQLETYVRSNPDSADGRFLLGYHYMTEGYQDAAINQFERVVALQPKDLLAQRIVQAAMPDTAAGSTAMTSATATPPTGTAGSASAPSVPAPPSDLNGPAVPPPTQSATPEESGPKPTVEQLTGSWTATHDDGKQTATFNFTLKPDGTFTWKFAEGDKTSNLEGKYTLTNDMLVLEPTSGPPMIGHISGAGSNGFHFKMIGAPQDDPGLQFTK